MVAIYIGIEDPLLIHHIHKGLVFRDWDSVGGPLFRMLDTFGDSLSNVLYLGAGHGRFTLYNELEDLSHRIALLAGSRRTCSARPSTREGSRRDTKRNARPRMSTAVASSSNSSSGHLSFRAGTLASLIRGTTGRPLANLARHRAPDCLSRVLGLALVVKRSGKVRGSAGRDHRALQKNTPPKDGDGQNKHLHAPVLRRILHVLVLHVSPKGSVWGGMRVLGVGATAGRRGWTR